MNFTLFTSVWNLFVGKVVDVVFVINGSSPDEGDFLEKSIIKGVTKNVSFGSRNYMKVFDFGVGLAVFT